MPPNLSLRNLFLLLSPDSLASISEHILQLPLLCYELENTLVKLSQPQVHFQGVITDVLNQMNAQTISCIILFRFAAYFAQSVTPLA